MPVQWAVERDEIPYPYKVHVRGRAAVATSAGQLIQRSHVNIATVAMRNSFLFHIVKTKDKRTGCINIQKHNYVANYISRIY